MNKLELFFPLKPFVVSQKFGQNATDLYKKLGMKGHNGEDQVGFTGQLIRAAHDGIVTFTGEDSSAGLGVVVRTLDERDYLPPSGIATAAFFKTIYWHILPNSFFVKAGDIVKCGDPLAKCDTTGQATGPHLHWGLKPMKQGEQEWAWYNIEQDNGFFGAINPADYTNGLYAEDYASWQAQLKVAGDKLKQLAIQIKSRNIKK